MIICRTPFRVSFFGGGTDYPGWYRRHGGQVLSTAIDKYCYITLRHLPPFFEHTIRAVYSKIELCRSLDEVKHPAIRETLRFMRMGSSVEIHHDGDLPARSGMGSSSSFTVGLLHALYALKGRMPSKEQLAREAIHIEQDMIKETVGSQDQCAAAYGGLNHIIFHRDGEIEVRPLTVANPRLSEFTDHLMLFYTGIMRTASDVADTYVENLDAKEGLLRTMHGMVDEGIRILQSNRCICGFGELLHEAWQAKRSLSPNISNGVVDDLYSRARENGAIGGKLIGAGGGGFLLLFVPPSARERVREELTELLHVPFTVCRHGSQIIFYEPQGREYRQCENDRRNRVINGFRELDTLKG
ncbi:kinase [Desulfovibrio aminophilus]|nr:kinase [Desulfovibrio aminophilus]MCM0755911.1 kinase [Desulfovibrio aminophilus]